MTCFDAAKLFGVLFNEWLASGDSVALAYQAGLAGAEDTDVLDAASERDKEYRAFTDREIVDALLLHHIGVTWQVKLKEALRRIFDSKAWTVHNPPMPKSKNSGSSNSAATRAHLPSRASVTPLVVITLKGVFLYRMHDDDLWLWDADASKVASGWAKMKAHAQPTSAPQEGEAAECDETVLDGCGYLSPSSFTSRDSTLRSWSIGHPT